MVLEAATSIFVKCAEEKQDDYDDDDPQAAMTMPTSTKTHEEPPLLNRYCMLRRRGEACHFLCSSAEKKVVARNSKWLCE